MNNMIAWCRDETDESDWFNPLIGRSLEARVDEEVVALALVHYELDKSSLLSVAQRQQLLVVDAIALSPSASSPTCRVMIDAGVRSTLTDMAQCHGMRVQFAFLS